MSKIQKILAVIGWYTDLPLCFNM